MAFSFLFDLLPRITILFIVHDLFPRITIFFNVHNFVVMFVILLSLIVGLSH